MYAFVLGESHSCFSFITYMPCRYNTLRWFESRRTVALLSFFFTTLRWITLFLFARFLSSGKLSLLHSSLFLILKKPSFSVSHLSSHFSHLWERNSDVQFIYKAISFFRCRITFTCFLEATSCKILHFFGEENEKIEINLRILRIKTQSV